MTEPREPKRRKLAIFGNFSTQFISQAIQQESADHGLELSVLDTDVDQAEQLILDRGSALYAFDPDYIAIYESPIELQQMFMATAAADRHRFSDSFLGRRNLLWRTVTEALTCKIVHSNVLELPDPVFGNYAAKIRSSYLYQLRKINLDLMHACQEIPALYLNDIASTLGRYANGATSSAIDYRLHTTGSIDFDLDFSSAIGSNTLQIISALEGGVRKCLVLDLDNTLWGGILGDVGKFGVEVGSLGIGKAFSEVQLWARQLRERGIILAVCSKNDEPLAKEVFEDNKEMVLTLDDISVFVANWDNKAQNLERIRSTLNIGYDSMVFLDDSPVERELVRQKMPEVMVPELPEDPALYVEYLTGLNLFETASVSAEDLKRTDMYRAESQRGEAKLDFSSIDDYLEDLQMKAIRVPLDEFHIPRVAQLTQRSNQFNFRTIRYSQSDIEDIAQSDEYRPVCFSLSDRFGDYGTVVVVLLRKDGGDMFIDTWLMSCRVLTRTVEEFVLNQMVDAARDSGCTRLVGEYIDSGRNGIVRDLFDRFGFIATDGLWYLDLADYEHKKTFVSIDRD